MNTNQCATSTFLNFRVNNVHNWFTNVHCLHSLLFPIIAAHNSLQTNSHLSHWVAYCCLNHDLLPAGARAARQKSQNINWLWQPDINGSVDRKLAVQCTLSAQLFDFQSKLSWAYKIQKLRNSKEEPTKPRQACQFPKPQQIGLKFYYCSLECGGAVNMLAGDGTGSFLIPKKALIDR